MSNGILDQLSTEKPKGRIMRVKNASLNVVRAWVKKHAGEIEEARARGYSWPQINRACYRVWSNLEGLRDIEVWRNGELISSCHRAVKDRW